jgi:NAD(P)H dehydrogenase (quinone)
MSDRLFLVTGATSETGRYSIQLLRKRGRNGRALVHKEDERVDRRKSN